MTWETCIKQAENCKKHGDEMGELMYRARADRKRNRSAEYYNRQAQACEDNGNHEGAIKWRALAEQKNLVDKPEKPKEPKEKSDGKK